MTIAVFVVEVFRKTYYVLGCRSLVFMPYSSSGNDEVVDNTLERPVVPCVPSRHGPPVRDACILVWGFGVCPQSAATPDSNIM